MYGLTSKHLVYHMPLDMHTVILNLSRSMDRACVAWGPSFVNTLYVYAAPMHIVHVHIQATEVFTRQVNG